MPISIDNIEALAVKLRLKTKRGEDGEPIIPGKLGHLYEHDPDAGEFGLVLVAADGSRLDNTLRARKRKALREGFELHQEGDAEAILLFDPTEARQARLAAKLVGARQKRKQSPRQLANLRRGPETGASQGLEAAISARGEGEVGERHQAGVLTKPSRTLAGAGLPTGPGGR